MKDENIKKTTFFYQYSELNLLEDYLAEQAAQGWLLQTIKGQRMTFTRTEPQALRFCVLVYDVSFTGTWISKQMDEAFITTCNQAGWQLTAKTSSGILEIFHTADPSALPIQVDPKAKLKTIYKLMNNGWLAAMFSAHIFLWGGLPLILGQLTDRLLNNVLVTGTILILEMSFWVLCMYFVRLRWYLRAKKALDLGTEILPLKRRFTIVPLTIILLLNYGFSLFCMFLYGFRCPDWIFWTIISFMILLACSALSQIILLAAKKFSQSFNVGIFILLIIYVAFFIIQYALLHSTETKQPLPLSLSTLGISDAIDNERYFESTAPGLIYKSEFRDYSDTASLSCEMYETKFSFLIPVILEEEFLSYRYDVSDRDALLTEAFGANDVYCEQSNSYLVVYDDTVIEIKTNWGLSAEQMQAIGERLG